MKCPVCARMLSPIQIRGITVDVCQGGCGGVWFDNFELNQIQRPVEADDSWNRLHQKSAASVSDGSKRICPKCADVKMMRHFYDRSRTFQIDSCPGCGGCWLDAGELALVRRSAKAPAGARVLRLPVESPRAAPLREPHPLTFVEAVLVVTDLL